MVPFAPLRVTDLRHYSPRIDSIGSTRDARRAGSHAASSPTITIAPATPTNAAASSAPTPNSRLRSARVEATAASSPTTTPTTRGAVLG